MKDSLENSVDTDTLTFNKDNLQRGQKILIDISPILIREREPEGFRHGHTAECEFIRHVHTHRGDRALVTYEFYEGEPEAICYEQIIKIL